ncbi:MAG TPA: single-stranded DNA-binding protein, partial [Verrucomicrobiota bacterium]|nr:single-stranded DNA-binding protein [Verrucomicrobiota bacterium]
LVEGRLKLDTWDDKQTGQKKSKLAVVLESFSFLDSGSRGDAPAGGPPPAAARPNPAAAPAGSDATTSAPAAEEDDVPF